MSGETLPQEVRDLLLRHIGSVAHLEALLFFRAHPTDRLGARSLAQRLYASETEMIAALAELGNDGFLAMENGLYCYAPRPEDRRRIDALADAYAHQLIAITNLIHDRRRNIQAFSDAFKLRKER
jgi:hypothetical protein